MSPRLRALISLCVITPLGFALKLVRFGPPPRSDLEMWLNNSAGGVAYVVFWCLVVFFLIPRRRAVPWICLGVFIVTCALECLQLWQPAPPHPLAWARSHFIGRTLLGTSFSWLDFPHYLAGAGIGYAWLRLIAQPQPTRNRTRDPN